MAGRAGVRNRGEWRPAAELPVARIAVDVPLAHLDRPFDYAVPEHLDADARVGVRVRVRFAGRLVDGFVLERVAASEHPGRLAWLEKVVSTEQALPPEIAALCRAVADRYGGVLADVLRLALPPRHARVEAESARAAARSITGVEVRVAPDADGAVGGVTAAAGPMNGTGVPVAAADRADQATTAPRAPGGVVAEPQGGVVADARGRAATEPRGGTAAEVRSDAAGVRDGVAAEARDGAATGARNGDDAELRRGTAAEVRGDTAAETQGGPAEDRRRGGGGGAAVGGRVGWQRYPRGQAFLRALGEGRAAHAVWQALPGEAWAERLADAAQACVDAGRGALLVVPDQRDVDLLHAACAARLGDEAVVALTADLGPAERYRRWLAVRRGQVRVVVGTRSAAFAPVARPGLLAVWDDGDDSHAEPRAPYPHVRDVLVLRAHAVGAALLVGGYARTAEGQLLVESGWASEIVADRATVRAAMPRVVAQGESDLQLARDPLARAARLPSAAFEAARSALAAGRPVLVQTPRAGYVPWLSCAACRETARCRRCAGPLGLPGRTADAATSRTTAGAADHAGADGAAAGARGAGAAGSAGAAVAQNAARAPGAAHHRAPGTGAADAAAPSCRWCGRVESAYRCGACGSRRLRAGVVGTRRTAEELGRAFPGVPVRISGGGAPVLNTVAARAEIVVATPGAEPRAAYGAALLLDGWALLARPDLRVAEETLRRWMAAAALVVPHTDGGRVLVMADPALPPVQALVRWDPVGHAAAELAARTEVGFPPAVRMAAIDAAPAALKDILDELTAELPAAEVLGPVELDPAPDARADDEVRERALVRVPRAEGRALAHALHVAQAARTARKATDPVRVRMDPPDVG
ncbi:MAG TPA: primosomal protein N' [Pseudonocardia sp.]|nr:primosomal protein N' [Pseudonocardia sp.]